MSQTSTSHTQWIQQAVAAAKAGNPSVAKIQLQQAAEAAPADAAVWLWMGWLADSPASAAQCLELARSDERFQKVADAGIEYARALAEFQLTELVIEEPPEEAADVPVASDPAVDTVDSSADPVEVVEEVAAVVETLQQEDAAEAQHEDVTGSQQEDVAEARAVDTAVPPASSASDTDANADQPESDDGKPESETADIAEDSTSLAEPEAAIDVEAALLESANELWQTTDHVAESADHPAVSAGDEVPSGQLLWKPAAQQILSASDSDADPTHDSATGNPPEPVVDESADDFVFAFEDDAELEAVRPARSDPSAAGGDSQPVENISNTSDSNTSDQWLGQARAESPQTPVWRKAQSDWFSVDAPSDPEPEQPVPVDHDLPSTTALTEQATILTTGTPTVASGDEVTPHDATVVEATVASQQHRVTASDVWQTAAIEKSTLSEAPAIQTPVYQPVVAPTSAEAGAVAKSAGGSVSPLPASPIAAEPASAGSLPANQAGAPLQTGNDSTAAAVGQKTVLVVDDSPTVRKLVSITLEKRGYKVACAFDGVAAIKEIAAHNPSLILMDVNMPRLDGYQLCKLVKKHETTCDIPVLMLSGKDGMFDRLRGRLVGCAGHVTKPFAPEVLIEAVEQHITHGKEA